MVRVDAEERDGDECGFGKVQAEKAARIIPAVKKVTFVSAQISVTSFT